MGVGCDVWVRSGVCFADASQLDTLGTPQLASQHGRVTDEFRNAEASPILGWSAGGDGRRGSGERDSNPAGAEAVKAGSTACRGDQSEGGTCCWARLDREGVCALHSQGKLLGLTLASPVCDGSLNCSEESKGLWRR